MFQAASSSDGAPSPYPSDEFCVAYVVDREGRTRSAGRFPPATRSRHPLVLTLMSAVTAVALGGGLLALRPGAEEPAPATLVAKLVAATAPAPVAKPFGDERPFRDETSFTNDKPFSVDTTAALPNADALDPLPEPAVAARPSRASRSAAKVAPGKQDGARAKPGSARRNAGGRAAAPALPGALAESGTETVTPGSGAAQFAALFDPVLAMGGKAEGLDGLAPLGSEFHREPVRLAALSEPDPAEQAQDLLLPPAGKYERSPVLRPHASPAPTLKPAAAPPPAQVAVLSPAQITASRPAPMAPASTQIAAPPAQVAQVVPLPMSRPSDLVASAEPPRGPQRYAALPSTQTVFRAALEGRNGRASTGSALAYAGTDSEAIDASPRARLGLSSNLASALTAVYDISAQRVFLPSGKVLEAHSGKGIYMDDPRYVNLRMRGSTPPGTYLLSERESPYHGVRALRMTPVGGAGAIHGRTGILAHTYMLRQRGASHGCVVFADYRVFLNAYLSGEIRRIVVVPGGKGGALPAVAENRGGFLNRFMGEDGG